MSHNFYADIEESQKELFEERSDLFDEADDVPGYNYNHPPSIDVGIIMASNWIPWYLKEGVEDDMSHTQALLYGQDLQRKAGGYIPQSDTENNQVKEAIKISMWLSYWAHSGIAVHGSPEQ